MINLIKKVCVKQLKITKVCAKQLKVSNITSEIKGTSQAKLYEKLGLETLKLRQWCQRLCIFYKVKTSDLPLYLSKYITIGKSFL